MMQVTCGFTIPITLYGLPPDLGNVIRVMGEIKDAGFSSMEMEIVAGEYREYAENWDKVINRSRSLGLKVVSIMAVTYDMFSFSSGKREQSLADFSKICEMTAEIGAGLVTNCFYLPPEMVPRERKSIYRGGALHSR